VQQDEPGWQQLAPQQSPQDEFPVRAIADSDDIARIRTANSLNFMGFSSRLRYVDARAAGRTSASEAQMCKQAHREV
jgi:hypothetical protein